MSCRRVVVYPQAKGAVHMTGLLYKIGVAALLFMVAVTTGYMAGRNHDREAALKAAVAAYQTRERINHETDSLKPDALCLTLGGMSNECAAYLRGMDKATAGK